MNISNSLILSLTHGSYACKQIEKNNKKLYVKMRARVHAAKRTRSISGRMEHVSDEDVACHVSLVGDKGANRT